MQLDAGETIVHRVTVEADDTGRPAHLFLTDRRLVIEYETREELIEALWEAKFQGDEFTPRPVNLRWAEIAEVQSLERYRGGHILKIVPKEGQPTIWKTQGAHDLARWIEYGRREGRFELPDVQRGR
jgi:hypothetical protein